MSRIKLSIVTQEKIVLEEMVDEVIAPATEGEVAILPQHIPLFTKLNPGEIKIKKEGKFSHFVTAGGFMDVNNNLVTILADSAVRADEIDMAKAQEAKKRAEQLLTQKLSKIDFTKAEASLRKALIELKIAQRRHFRGQEAQKV
jgi:F-type H+-transporting ATPase subunit epsilon